MKRLMIEKLIVISQSEAKSLEVSFYEGLNLILGGNKTGKSSIIKSIFYTFGCQCRSIEKEWKDLISSYLLYFRYGKNQYCIVRQDKQFQIFNIINEQYNCIIETSFFHEYSNCLMSIFEIKMPCINTSNSTEINITPPLLFRFQYIDQDDGWNKIGEPFNNVNYIKDWKKNTNKYVCGYLNDRYYSMQAEKAICIIDRDNKKAEINNNKNFVLQISSNLKQLENIDSIEEVTASISKFFSKSEQLRREQYACNAERSVLENNIYVTLQQLHVVEHNMIETEKDILFALEQNDELVCPTCGAKYSNRLYDQLSITSDFVYCESIKEELVARRDKLEKDLLTIQIKLDQINSDLNDIDIQIKESQELLSYSAFYKNKGQYEIYESCKKQLEILQSQLDQLLLHIAKLDENINMIKSKKRSKEIKAEIEKYCRVFADKINVPKTYIKLYDFVQKIEHTGSDTPRLVYMYQSALYLYNLNRCQSPFNFYIIDTPNQQGQDAVNLQSIYNSLELFLDKDGQVIVGTERETGIENKASNVIILKEKRRCLTDQKYKKHIELLNKLNKLGINWANDNHRSQKRT